jgi:DNA-binding response OmpR family regulator
VKTTGKLILLVEDEPQVSIVVSRVLAGIASEISTAATIKEAEALLETVKPDLLILDRLLPDGDGVQLLARLKRRPELRDLPVLVLSAKFGTEELTEGLDLGADDYVPKPFSAVELRARVAALLRRAEKFAPRKAGPGCAARKKT